MPVILVVDDSPSNIEVLAGILEDEYEIRVAVSGRQALDQVAAQRDRGGLPDLILLDVMMPGMSGYDLCAALRQLGPAVAEIPVIFVTSLSDIGSESRAFEIGGVDFISKPLQRAVVLARVRLHLGLVQKRLELQALNKQLERSLAALDQANEELRHASQHDRLTGLANRALLMDRLQQGLAAMKRRNEKLALLFIDLDRFKPINDEHGHAAGDAVLVEVASRMRGCVRESDTVCRMGGDEFVVLLQNVSSADAAAAVAAKILEAVKEPIGWEGASLRVSGSIGVVLAPDLGERAEDLLKKADALMYQVKQSGRGRVRVCGT